MTVLVPKKVFFTSGKGKADEELLSFEMALREAGIERLNLVTVSSIYPPGAKIISKKEGLKELLDGQITFCVMSRITTYERGVVSAAVGLARTADKEHYGYISEYHGHIGLDEARQVAEDMATYMLASLTDIEEDEVNDVRSVGASIQGDDEHWVTALAAAIFIL